MNLPECIHACVAVRHLVKSTQGHCHKDLTLKVQHTTQMTILKIDTASRTFFGVPIDTHWDVHMTSVFHSNESIRSKNGRYSLANGNDAQFSMHSRRKELHLIPWAWS